MLLRFHLAPQCCSPLLGRRAQAFSLAQRGTRPAPGLQRALPAEKDACRQPECLQQKAARVGAVLATALITGAFIAVLLLPAQARVLTERLGQREDLKQQGGDVAEIFRTRSAQEDRASRADAAGPSVRQQVDAVVRITREAKTATKDGDFEQALRKYTEITAGFPDLAITNYARLGRALLLYQTGSKSQAILELEDLEASMRGYPELHAALACLLYTERPGEVSYAEEQFDVASEFDGRYSDVAWVEATRAWPPAMLAALDKFVNLQ